MAVKAEVITSILVSDSVALDKGNATFSSPHDVTPLKFASGSGAGQVNKEFTDTRTLALSTSENLDLAGGLTDPFGNVLTFTEINAIEVRADPTNVNNVVVGGAASNPWVGPWGGTTPTIAIPPGGRWLIVHPGAGWPVVASTGDLLKILNGGAGTAVNYDIKIIGR